MRQKGLHQLIFEFMKTVREMLTVDTYLRLLNPFGFQIQTLIHITLMVGLEKEAMLGLVVYQPTSPLISIGILKNGSLVKEMLSKDVSSTELESIYLDYMKD